MLSLDKKYFQRLIESSPDIIIAVDKSGTVNYYNDGARTSLGYSSEEIIGEGCTRIYPSIDEARRVMKAMRASVDKGRIASFETEFRNKAGEIIPGDGKQTLTKYRARSHDIYIGQWGADYWDPHTNADTFARNPDNADDAKSKPLAWRNAWAIPELTKKTDAAVLERDAAKRKAMYEEIQAEFRKTSPFVMLYQQTEVAAYRSDVQGLKLGPTSDTTYMFRVSKL